MTRSGAGLATASTLLVAVLLVVIYVIDPILTITPDLQRLYGAPDHQSMWQLATVWAITAIGGALALAQWGISAKQTTVTNAGVALLTLGGACASSFLVSFPIGLGFIIDAENGGYYSGGTGALAPAGTVAIVGSCAVLASAVVLVADLVRNLNR